MKKFQPFVSWEQVLRHVSNRNSIYYQAPMDAAPVYVGARRRSDGQVRVVPDDPSVDPFWADRSHLERFRHREGCTCEGPYPQLGTTD